jgi:eukaryotic-like serine/threonine-protein kinase
MRPNPAREFHGTARFRVIRSLGSGGAGTVYEVHDRERDGRVALKTLHTTSGEALARFKREFRSLVDLHHPNLVRLGELGEEEGVWFFTMELVHGCHFLEHVRGGANPPHLTSLGADGPTRPSATANGAAAAAARRGSPAASVLDEGRVRASLAQLARGLAVLHRAGKVHRDIKSSNVLVTDAGRVVVVDFGAIIEASNPYPPVVWRDSVVMGTVSHMAPEHIAGGPVGPAADWYGVGVLLYQALTGRLPFTGTELEIAEQKQLWDPVPPHQLASGIPADLGELCVRLLARDPAARIAEPEILYRLDANHPVPLDAGPPISPVFVGRTRELDGLEQAFRDSQRGRPVVVVVHGQSGVGKTALLAEFGRRVQARDPDLVLLTGRCHERESVPYRAVDGIIDALARFLARLTPGEVAPLLPPRASLLAQLFPVLRLVDSFAEARQLTGLERVDPQELRLQARAAFAALFACVSRRYRVILVIDDLQWADADGLEMLETITSPDNAGILLVAAVRPAEPPDEPSAAPAWSAALTGKNHVVARRLALGELVPEEAVELARILAAQGDRPIALDAAQTAAEAEGNPFFISELVRFKRASGTGPAPGRLAEVVWARIDQLEPSARETLELLAIAGSPMEQEVVASAGGLSLVRFADEASVLRAANFVRVQGVRATDRIEPYHDRIAEAVRSRLAADRRRFLHRKLANALERTGAAGNSELLAIHWSESGDRARGSQYAAAAARQASESLAFNRAVRLYRMATRLIPPESPRYLDHLVATGDALVNAGRGAEAAAAYQEAAERTEGAAALDLRRRAAEQLLRCGLVDEGIAASAQVLAAVGMRLPRTPRGALASLAWHRIRLRLRGLRHRLREAGDIAAEELRRIDVCWSMAIGLGIIDTIRGADFQTRHALLALRAGEPRRVARALAIELAYAPMFATSARRRRGLEAASLALARRLGDPHALGLAIGCAGTAAFLEGRWRTARERCEEAEVVLREQCQGVAWELDGCQLFALASAIHMGDFEVVRRRGPRLVSEAEQRGDRFAATNLRTRVVSLLHLAGDEVARARREISEAMRPWSVRGFHVEHYFQLYAETLIDLYDGAADSAHRRWRRSWRPLRASLLLRLPLIRSEATHVRGLAALALAVCDPARRRALLGEAERSARTLGRLGLAWCGPGARGLLGGIAAARGDRGRALAHLAAAAAGFDGCDMVLHAAATRLAMGQILGGEPGAALAADARGFLEQHQVANPARYAGVWSPKIW